MRRVLLFTVLLFGCVAALAADYEMSFDGMRYVGQVEKTFSVSTGGTLTMKQIEGDVSIIGEARKDVEIVEQFRLNAYSEASARQIFAKERSRYLHKGENVTVEGTQKSRRYECNFLVRVPVEFGIDVDVSGGDIDIESIQGEVFVETSGGDVKVLSIRGNSDIRTSGGDVVADDCDGDLKAVTSGGDIIVDHVSGQVYIKTSGGDINVSQVSGAGEIATSGGDIDLIDLQGTRFDVRTSGGDIGVNKIAADLSLTTSGGDVVVGTVSGSLDLYTSGGDIEVDRVKEDLDARTSGGDIEIGEVGGRCQLKTSGGDIEIASALGDAEVETSGGEILISAVFGSVWAETSGGNVEVVKVYHKGTKHNEVDVSSSGGDLLIYLPDNMPADIYAEISVRDRWEDNEIRSDIPLEISRHEKGSRILLVGKGDMNGGGDEVVLKTTDGDIKIVRILEK